MTMAMAVASLLFLWVSLWLVPVSCSSNVTRRRRQLQDLNNNVTQSVTTNNNCVAGGSGYGLSFDYTRKADVVSLHWENIPQYQITVEFWYKSTDTFLKEACVFSYSAFDASNNNDEGMPYEAANEVSMRISRHRWILWRGGASECELHSDTNPLIEESYTDGRWHHYAFTIDATTQSAVFYLDGRQLDFGTTWISNVTRYAKAAFSNDWDVAESPDAGEYYGRIETEVLTVQDPCNAQSYQVLSSENPNNFTALLLPTRDCPRYDQAVFAAQAGAQFIVFELEQDEDVGSTVILGETQKLSLPVIAISQEDGQAIQQQGKITFARSRAPAEVGSEFGQPIHTGGVLTLGQEPDDPWGGFDPFQAMNGIMDELRVWDTVRTPKQIKAHHKVSIDTENDPEAVHLNLYYTFDDYHVQSGSNDTTATTAMDSSPLGQNTGLVGALPTIRNQVTFVNGDAPSPPTRPDWIATTSSPLVGRGHEVVVPVRPGRDTIVELKSLDPEGEDLVTKIVTVPNDGLILDLEGETSLSGGDLVVDVNRTENKRILFRAPENFGTDATFEYSVEDEGGIPVVATVRLVLHIVEDPAPAIETVQEDSLNFHSLAKPSQSTQNNMQVVISRLPEHGSLFQIQLAPGKPALYDNLATYVDEFGPMEAISQVGTIVNNTRGIIMYAPDKDGFSDPVGSVYDAFGYKFVDDGVESEEALRSFVVVAVNDSPEFDSTSLRDEGGYSVSTNDNLLLKLDSFDVDADTVENFSERSFARITQFPKAGLLYQYDEKADNNLGQFMDGSITQVPQIFAWASRVVRFSSQYSRCGKVCYTWKNPACSSDCTIKDYTAEQILGEPDIYPDYRNGPKSMDFAEKDVDHEWIELEFPFEMYINGFELYETSKPGSLWKVSTTDDYIDDPSLHCARAGFPDTPVCTEDTNWKTLWSKPKESVAPGPETATIHNPPLCPSTKKTSIIRLDFDTVRVPGWVGLDAVKLIGSLDSPPGLVDDSLNRLLYLPKQGLHGADDVSFLISDCLSSGDIHTLNITITAPSEEGEFSKSVFHEEDVFLLSSPNEVHQETLDLSPVMTLIADVLCDEAPSMSGQVWHTTALGISSGTQLPNDISMEAPQVTLDLGVAHYGTPHSGIEIWLTDRSGRLTFRVKYRLLLCDKGVLVDELAINGRNVCLVEDDNLIPVGILAFGYLATAVSWSLSLYFLSWIYRYRNDSLVKVSQIEFLVLICIGAMISSSTLIALGVQAGSGEDTTGASIGCAVAPFLYTIGWGLQYSSLTAKTYRLYRITESHKKGQPQTVTSWSMFRIVVFAFCVDFGIVVAWTILNPLVYEREEIGRDIDVENGLITVQSYGQCRASKAEPSTWAFVGPLLIFHFFLLVAANSLLLKVRKMKDRYQESKQITMAMVLMLEILIVGVPLLLAVEGSAAADYGVLVAIVALNDIGILSFIFIPKVMLQAEGPAKEADHVESIILASFKKMSNSRWDEGIKTVHELLDPDSETRNLMTADQAERLEDVKTLLVHGIHGNDDSKFLHIPKSLTKNKASRRFRDDNVGFVLQEFAGVANSESARSIDSGTISGDESSPETATESNLLPEFLQLADKEALFEKLSWENLKRWDFNVFDIVELTDGHPLLFVGWAILAAPHSQYAMARACGREDVVLDDFTGYDFVGPKDRSALRIPNKTLCDYLRVIENDYVSENPYHNEIHAADVLQTTHCLLQMSAGVLDTITDIDRFSILLAAAVHDVAHPGNNNAFQINSRTDLAMIYNDASVLENRHASLAFMRMLGVDESQQSPRHDELNILKNTSKQQFNSIRSKVMQAILQTDMSDHFRTVSMVKAMIMEILEGKELSDDDKWKLLMYLLHLADISNQGKEAPLFEKWTERCLAEFFLQGDKEAEMGLTISPNCNRNTTKVPDSQVGFITYIVLPSFEVLAMIIPSVQDDVVSLIQRNLRYWENRKGGKEQPGLQTRQDNADSE